MGHLVDDEAQHQVTGASLIADSDCKACHAPERKSIGPSYADISNKYRKRNRDIAILANKVINGGSGVWGETPMAAHPSISLSNARLMVEYILSFGEKGNMQTLPVEGSFTPANHQQNGSRGLYILKAMYTDRGADAVGPSTGEQVHAFRSNIIKAIDFDKEQGVQAFRTDESEVVIMPGDGYISFEDIDLTGIRSISLDGFVMGQDGKKLMELRLDSPEGEIIAETVLSSTGKALRQESYEAKGVAKLDNSDGKHNLYLLFKSPESEESSGGLTRITFSP